MKKNLFIFISIFVLFFAWNTSFAVQLEGSNTWWASRNLGPANSNLNTGSMFNGTATGNVRFVRILSATSDPFTDRFGADWQSYDASQFYSWSPFSFASDVSNYFSIVNGTDYYLIEALNGQYPSFISPVPPNTDTRIISVIPGSNTTVIPFVATSTDRFADFDVDLLTYYNNPSTSTISIITTFLKNNNIPSYNYTKTQLSGFGTEQATSSYNVAQSVPFGNYDLTITLLNSSLEIISATTSSNITFGSSTNAITFSDIYGASSSNMFDISQIATSSTCGITDLTGCFKNAIIWAFYPTSESLNLYSSFMGLIQEKAPIGYFFIIKNAINGLSTSSESAFVITIPSHLKTYIFNPIDIGIASILWVYFIFMFYKRLKHIQI